MLDMQARVNSLNTDISGTRRRIPTTQAELSEAQGRLNAAKAEQKNAILEELRQTKLEITQLQERLKANNDVVLRTELLSPVDGILQRLHVHTIGGTVRPGELLAEITPSNDNLIIEARIDPKDRAHVWYGQKANITVTAFNYMKYGTLQAKVLEISADSIEDNSNQPPYYRVKLILDTADSQYTILPGMVTEVHLLAEKRTVLQYLLDPVLRTKRNAFRSL